MPGSVAKPDIVVIVLDTVRADRLGMYGYAEGTSPRLDAWSQNARIYDQMMANAPWTLPSHASMFTGRYPIEHGAHGTPPESQETASALAPGSPTVARALRSAGYRTAAIAANRAFLQSSFGLNQGFDLYLCETLGRSPRGVGYVSGDRMLALAEAFLSQKRSDDPLFLFLNFMDAHSPWVPREGYVRNEEKINFSLLPSTPGWSEAEQALYAGGTMPEGGAESWSLAYDAELRFLDAQVGALLERLPSLGIGSEDYVFILSDHGEYLGEHGLLEHSKDVYEPVLHVPLLIQGPSYAPGRDAQPLQHHDLATMILAAAGLGSLPNAETTHQLQVAELYWTRRKDLHSPAYGDRFNRIRRAWRSGDLKLILGSDGSAEAYDLEGDPSESRNQIHAEWAKELQTVAELWLADRVAAPVSAPDKSTDITALRELGYLE